MSGRKSSYPIKLLVHTISLLRADAGYYLFIAIYAVIALVFLTVFEKPNLIAFSIYLVKWPFVFGFMLPIIAISTDLVFLFGRFRGRHAAAKHLFSPSRVASLISGLMLLMALGIFQGAFTSIKNGFPALYGGFPFDRTQADMDAFLHFGIDPWRILFRVADFDSVRWFVELNYNVLWFLVCFGGLFFVVTSPSAARIRTRYLVCYLAVWIVVGNVVAGMFLSAGPAFYGLVTGDMERFAEQLAFLSRSAANPNSAVSYQNYLWDLHQSGSAGFGSGISAFPSVHVALITLNALFIAQYNRKLGLIALGYVFFVAASSVYLAWHYAIDGYVSIVLTTLIYFVVRRWMTTPRRDTALETATLDPAKTHSF